MFLLDIWLLLMGKIKRVGGWLGVCLVGVWLIAWLVVGWVFGCLVG